jgi:hypothetical protein
MPKYPYNATSENVMSRNETVIAHAAIAPASNNTHVQNDSGIPNRSQLMDTSQAAALAIAAMMVQPRYKAIGKRIVHNASAASSHESALRAEGIIATI